MSTQMLNVLSVVFIVVNAEARSVVDLTHTFDKNNPKYPLQFLIGNEAYEKLEYYKMSNLHSEYVSGDLWVSIRKVEYYEHQGTHIDAPGHTGRGQATLEAIPPERLIGPGVVIDVKDKVKKNPDFAVTVQDIKDHEAKYGRIPPMAIVIMNSGWGLKYPSSEQVFGTKNLLEVSTFHYPGWSPEACEMLLQERQVNVVGVDTPSVDPAQPNFLPCHFILQNNDVPLLEYVANLDAIPLRGTTIVIGAPKFRDGTGGPTRVLAIVNEDQKGSSAHASSPFWTILSIVSLTQSIVMFV